MADSSTELKPLYIFPSTGIMSPGFNNIESSTFTLSTGTSWGWPLTIKCAMVGLRFNKLSSSLRARFLANSSKAFPPVNIITITAAATYWPKSREAPIATSAIISTPTWPDIRVFIISRASGKIAIMEIAITPIVAGCL